MDKIIGLLLPSLWQTLHMVAWSAVFSTILGGAHRDAFGDNR